jgi:uncharacterized repeat protein (TIGR03803 family)
VGKLNWANRAYAVVLVCAATAIALPAQTFTTLGSFDSADGGNPSAALVQATDGNFYGTTQTGGVNGVGTVFGITPSGTLTTLHSFCTQSDCADGNYPYAALVQATDGNLYGTTALETVFKITLTGTLTTLYRFCSQTGCADGTYPTAAVTQATNGNFYGTASLGGARDCPNGCGTIFEFTPNGTLMTLGRFDFSDGDNPYAGLVQASNGDFYGTTTAGGVRNDGTVFKVTADGTLTTLHSFDGTDGANPAGVLVQASDGNLYGTTQTLGGNGNGGTIFRITPSGKLTTIYNFCAQTGCADGSDPIAGLIQATDGNFYGTTDYGGTSGACVLGCGTVYKITPSGTLTTLHSFDSTDGAHPYAALVQYTSGKFYGTTYGAGASLACTGGCGTVFSLSVGLGPFVETQTTSGKVGAAIKILGTNLTDATSVTFNGTPATFTVLSSSEITTTVPTGATTGTVEVVTPSGALSSNLKFRVTP